MGWMHSLRLLSEGHVLARASFLLSLTLSVGASQQNRPEVAARLSEVSNDLAVIANKASTVSTLSSRDLRSIFLGAKDSWPDGTKLVAVSLPTDLRNVGKRFQQVFPDDEFSR